MNGDLYGKDTPKDQILQPQLDARTVQVSVDPDKGTITSALTAAEVPLGPQRTETIEDYANRMLTTSMRKEWVDQSAQRINQVPSGAASNTRPGFSIALPVEMPKMVRSFLGDAPPALNVSGSERLAISGTSNWTNQVSSFGRSPSLFPQLDMQQDLNINVTGTLGDKVAVDVTQFSGVQSPLSNRIALRFSGDEDQVIQKLDLGNTNLSLPNTQYVSYSGRNDGLFGVMSELKVGGTDVSILASKQEARSERTQFQGSTQYRAVTIDDWQYIQRTYFLLQQPDSMVDQDGNLRSDVPYISDINSINVFIDDRSGDNLTNKTPGYAEVVDPRPGSAPDPNRIVGNFNRKTPLKDYEVRRDLFGDHFPVLVLTTAIPENAVLAVTYNDTKGVVGTPSVGAGDTLRLKLIKAAYSDLPSDSTNAARYADKGPLASTREYELRNFYDLTAQNIDPSKAVIKVRRNSGGGDRDYLEQFTDPQTGLNIDYLEITGLDLLTQTQGGTPQPGHDGVVDRFSDYSFIDWAKGILYFPDLRPFAPRLDRPGDKYFAKSRIAPYAIGDRRRTLTFDKSQPLEIQSNDAPYELRTQQDIQEANTFYIWAQLASTGGSDVLYLRNTPIVEGSEIVTVNGEVLVRATDYNINYQTGEVDLLSPKARSAGANLNIDYSYAPLFSQASRTLVGSAIKFIDRPDYSLGSAFIYESRGLQEERPRLGEEPTRTLIGDLNGSIDVKPQAMTNIVNLLPFYKSHDPSRLTLTAEGGQSIPNPNTKNEVYLDDFEGARSSSDLSMDARSWFPCSPPMIFSNNGAFEDSIDQTRSNADLHWFNPFNVVEQKDLYPNLTRAEDSQASVTVMSWWVPQKWDLAPNDTTWFGLTTPLDPAGVDLSRSQFIDLWMNDFRDFRLVRHKGVKLHIDIGLVSKDAQLAPDQPPNGILDTEDKPPIDKQLTPQEDTGLDGVFDPDEATVYDNTAHLNASLADPHGDDWQAPNTGADKDKYVNERDPRRWRYNNGTERNQQYRGIPDTEDLDGTGDLGINSFFRYTIDLGDTNYLDTDVYEKYQNIVGDNHPSEDNGWRRFLIPLDDARREDHGLADIRNVKFVRVWLEGVSGNDLPPLNWDPKVAARPLIEFAQIEIVGNRWVANPIDSTASQVAGEDIVVRTVNNRDDAAIYDPPFTPGSQTQGGSTVQQQEQSLAIQGINIVPGGEVSAYRPTTLPEDYSRYRAIRFYAAALDFVPQDSLRFFVRFISDAGNDLNNYYEYSAPLPPMVPLGSKPIPWRSYDLQLTDFSNLKINLSADSLGAEFSRPGVNGGIETLKLVGRPSFTRVQRVTMGLMSARAAPDSAQRDSDYAVNKTGSGELWVDELRAVDVDRTHGSAQRISLLTNFADLISLNMSLDHQDANFQRLGQDQGSGSDFRNLRLSGSIALDRFMRGQGFNIPLTFDFLGGRSLPLFLTGQDIRLRPQDEFSQRTTQYARNLNISFTHSGSRSFLLRNTLDGLSFHYTWSDANDLSPTSADTSRTLAGSGQYILQPRDWLSIPVPLFGHKGHGLRIYPLPASLQGRFDMTTRRTIQYDRFDDGTSITRLGLLYSKDELYTFSGAWRVVDPLGFTFTSVRNANLPGITPLRVGGVNLGRQTAYNHRFDARWPFKLGPWLSPDIDASTIFAEQRGPELSPDLTVGSFTNGANMNFHYILPLTRFGHQPARHDTSGGFGLPFGSMLSKIGDVTARFSVTRTTAYGRITGYPSIGYRLGIDPEPGFEPGPNGPSVFANAQSSEATNLGQVRELSTQTMLWPGSSLRLAFNYTYNRRSSNYQFYETSSATWPDLSGDWGQVGKYLGLSRIFPTLSAQTRYSQRVDAEGLYNAPLTSRTFSTNWQPLLSLTGTAKSGLQTTVAAEYVSSLRQDFSNSLGQPSLGSVDTKSTNMTVRADLTKTLNPGSTFKFFGIFGTNLKSSLTLAWRSSYNKRTGGTTIPGQPRIGGEINNDRIDSSISGTYSFSRQVNGTVGLGFNQYRDFTRAVLDASTNANGNLTQRSLRLEASAQLSF
jgi:hypothetical protein